MLYKILIQFNVKNLQNISIIKRIDKLLYMH